MLLGDLHDQVELTRRREELELAIGDERVREVRADEERGEGLVVGDRGHHHPKPAHVRAIEGRELKLLVEHVARVGPGVEPGVVPRPRADRRVGEAALRVQERQDQSVCGAVEWRARTGDVAAGYAGVGLHRAGRQSAEVVGIGPLTVTHISPEHAARRKGELAGGMRVEIGDSPEDTVTRIASGHGGRQYRRRPVGSTGHGREERGGQKHSRRPHHSTRSSTPAVIEKRESSSTPSAGMSVS